MSENVLNNYQKFVDTVTSEPSKNKESFTNRVNELYDNGCDVSRLLTASIGISAEAGEFAEIVKKILFQGKPYSDENVFHMKRELGDILWYFANATIALGLDPYEIIDENIKKLLARYPGGAFDVYNSENRKKDDI